MKVTMMTRMMRPDMHSEAHLGKIQMMVIWTISPDDENISKAQWLSRDSKIFDSKHGNITWHSEPVYNKCGRRSKENIMHVNPGPICFASKNVDSIISSFQLFVRDSIVQ